MKSIPIQIPKRNIPADSAAITTQNGCRGSANMFLVGSSIKHLRCNRGISLIELLISLAILGLLAVGFSAIFLPAFQIGSNATVLNRKNATLTTALENVMGGKTTTEVNPGESGIDIVPGATGEEMTIDFPEDGILGAETINQTGNFAVGQDTKSGIKLKIYIPTK